jgi:hypothetical protein
MLLTVSLWVDLNMSWVQVGSYRVVRLKILARTYSRNGWVKFGFFSYNFLVRSGWVRLFS